MIAIVAFACTHFKFLQPVISQLTKNKAKIVLYHYDAHRGEKEYDRASISNIRKFVPDIDTVKNKKAFSSRAQLMNMLNQDKITKLLVMDATIAFPSELSKMHKMGIKVYSIQCFIDSTFFKDSHLDKFVHAKYHMSRAIADTRNKYNNTHLTAADRFVGSTIYDPLDPVTTGPNILVMLPNIRKVTIGRLGGLKNLVTIMEKISDGNNLIFKTRKKQWLPQEITKFASEIHYDEVPMYPPTVSKLLNKSYMTVLFRSSSVYECIYGNNYVFNVEMDINSNYHKIRQPVEEYFTSSVYNFEGVVESLKVGEILKDTFKFSPRHIDADARQRWLDDVVGCAKPGAEAIAKELIL